MNGYKKMKSQARGYIASGEFNGFRAPQHIQNQIIKLYCDNNNLEYVLSRAEYWMDGSSDCQLWASLKEGYKHIIFFSLWQMPSERLARYRIYEFCFQNKISLHFATERLKTDASDNSLEDIEILILTNSITSLTKHSDYLSTLFKIVSNKN